MVVYVSCAGAGEGVARPSAQGEGSGRGDHSRGSRYDPPSVPCLANTLFVPASLDVKRISSEDGGSVDRLSAGEKGVVLLVDRYGHCLCARGCMQLTCHDGMTCACRS